MQQTLSSILLPGYRRRILGLLLLHPEESLHGREIARRTGLPSGTLTRELGRLAQVGLLKREKRGNQMLYSADRACPVFEEIASLLRKTSGMADVLIEALERVAGEIDLAFIFGSVARGAETAGSDIDVLVIGKASFGSVIDALYVAQQQLGRELNTKVYSIQEWESKIKAKDAFVTDVLAKPKIFVIGNEDELTKLGRRKS